MKKRIFLLCFVIFVFTIPKLTNAEKVENIYEKRMELYKKTEAVTQIPWYYLAAIDQYERNVLPANESNRLVSISIPDELWYGIGNIHKIEDARMIAFFNGMGRDGDGDGLAQKTKEEDILYSFSEYLLTYGHT